MDEASLSQYYADQPPTVVQLPIKPHFDALSDSQKHYAHYLSRTSFLGTRIVLRQISPESEPIYDLIITLYKACNGDWKKVQEKTGVSKNDLQYFLEYAAQFLGNGGNYKSFGDSKFIPRTTPEAFEKIASFSEEGRALFKKAQESGGGIYATKEPKLMHLGYTEDGHMTSYYPDSPTITKEEISLIGDVCEKNKLLLENTRLRKTSKGYELLIASGMSNPPAKDRDLGDTTELPLEGKLKGKVLKLTFGDHIDQMADIAVNIKKATEFSDNDTEKYMCEEYAKSFGTGSLEAYKESQRYWIKDKGPMVEADIGFIETYRDPHGVRGEWEGFVAMVNKERTKAFGKLVSLAPNFIPRLPWPKSFEKEKFLSPDFTSLEVLTFCTSGLPVGINIPNYDDIRQNFGFKNVSLGNVLTAKSPNEPVSFIRESDLAIYRKNSDAAFEVQVGLHELLGHGTGKLLQETSPGEYNFDIKNPPISPITNKPISTWYKPGQTWSSLFGPIASSYEECRAECVSMVLSCDFDILSIFGIGSGSPDMDGPAGDVLYSSYLTMARAGICAIEYWDPKSRKWGQAHMQARFSILQAFLSAGPEFLKLHSSQPNFSDLEIHLDRSKILTHGRKAVESYLQKLHIFKSSADYEAGKKLYDESTDVDAWWADKVRPVVLRKKIPRKVFVQANTIVEGDKVVLKEYEPTCEGLIQSYVERDV
ncbi:MAG: hypothetical protein M1834_001770 [Cirrosporium novae-zelandiae]|nr:MAG: hypothetical protein M1834_001770 [Cirrosporium novae-zelandiae]